MKVAQEYINTASDGRSVDTPVVQIAAGNEPQMFTQHFHGWDPSLADKTSFVDPYLAKLADAKAEEVRCVAIHCLALTCVALVLNNGGYTECGSLVFDRTPLELDGLLVFLRWWRVSLKGGISFVFPPTALQAKREAGMAEAPGTITMDKLTNAEEDTPSNLMNTVIVPSGAMTVAYADLKG